MSDPHRPAYHFVPPSGWMNDPNGLLFVDGRLHLFYQHNPHGAFHDRIHWGHAVSDDLVSWQHLPIALTPTTGGYDADGCWSGCAVLDDGVPTLIYTGISPQVQCLATSADGLATWSKLAAPVLVDPPPGMTIFGDPPEIRDPWVWRHGDTWKMLLGSGIVDAGSGGVADPEGVLLLYESRDLRAWEYLGVTHRGRFAPGTTVWECPNLFPLGAHDVLLVSEQEEYKHTYAQVGRFDGRTFVPAWTGKTDHGAFFYAALTVEDPSGDRLMFGWIKEGRRDDVSGRPSLWSGVLSLARVLTVAEDGALRMAPAPAYESLRRAAHSLPAGRLPAGTRRLIPELAGDTLEISLRVRVPADASLTLVLRASPDGEEQTRVHVVGRSQELVVDTTGASAAADVRPERVAVKHVHDGVVEVRVFVDRSVVEVFADARTCVTARCYPTRADALHVGLETEGDVDLLAFTGWHMAPIW